MDRTQMIGELEEYWNKVQAKYPEEPMDIPAAIEYYWCLPLQQLQWEYEEKIGCKVK